jgi:hypothetical protein
MGPSQVVKDSRYGGVALAECEHTERRWMS